MFERRSTESEHRDSSPVSLIYPSPRCQFLGLEIGSVSQDLSRKGVLGRTSVVFGGSRVRGDFGPESDLDVGFGSLTKSQARKILGKAEDTGGLPLEKTLIVPGNKTRSIPEIRTPEEFFQRSGTRVAPDHRAGESFIPSGSITVRPDGSIVFTPGG